MEELGVIISIVESQADRESGTLTVHRCGVAYAAFRYINGRRRLVHCKSRLRLTKEERVEARTLVKLFWPNGKL